MATFERFLGESKYHNSPAAYCKGIQSHSLLARGTLKPGFDRLNNFFFVGKSQSA